MERVWAKFASHEEARRSNLEAYRRMSPEERLNILLQLIDFNRKEGDASSQRLERFVASLNSNRVEYMIVGAFALAFHGFPRYTGDLDILVRRSRENAEKLAHALAAFGFASTGLSAADFLERDRVIQLGVAPNRVDLLTSLTGVEFEEVWETRIPSEIEGLAVAFIGRASLIKNKQATGRAQDKADLEALGAACHGKKSL